MNTYEYISRTAPVEAIQVMTNAGYDTDWIRTESELCTAMEEFVGNEQERGLKALLEIHPDRDMITEFFGSSNNNAAKPDCGCKKKNNLSEAKSDNSVSSMIMHQGNICLMAAALIFGIAVIVNSKK